MNAIDLARQAYSSVQPALKTERALEAQILAGITARLDRDAKDFPKAVAAVHDNRRFWSTLAADVSADANGLPEALRAKIFYLAEFTDLHSNRFLKGCAALDPLIAINTAVIRGLNGIAEDR